MLPTTYRYSTIDMLPVVATWVSMIVGVGLIDHLLRRLSVAPAARRMLG